MSEPKDVQRMKVLKEVGMCADTFRSRTEELGKIAAAAFGNKHKSQMKNLENIANTALKVSDVLDYIKRQTGRAKPGKEWKHKQLGVTLLESIERTLKHQRKTICDTLDIGSPVDELDVYLLLIREYVRQIVIHFEFEIGTKETA